MAPKRKIGWADLGKVTRPFLHDDFITIALDDSSTTYKISKAVLCQASPYFTKALDGSFREATEQKLRLPGCDSDTLELVICYLTNGGLPDFDLRQSTPDTDEAADRSRTTQLKLAKLWCFADAHLMPRLQNEAMRSLLDIFGSWKADSVAARFVFESVPHGSRLRRAFVEEVSQDVLVHDDVTLHEFGSIQGFFCDYAKSLQSCISMECDHPKSCRLSDKSNRSLYMVSEE